MCPLTIVGIIEHMKEVLSHVTLRLHPDFVKLVKKKAKQAKVKESDFWRHLLSSNSLWEEAGLKPFDLFAKEGRRYAAGYKSEGSK